MLYFISKDEKTAKKLICPSCKSEDFQRGKNDDGYYYPQAGKPIRRWQYMCQGCGCIQTFGRELDTE